MSQETLRTSLSVCNVGLADHRELVLDAKSIDDVGEFLRGLLVSGVELVQPVQRSECDELRLRCSDGVFDPLYLSW
jgi:hypothetical protein